MSPAHALRAASHTDEQVEEFLAELLAAGPEQAKAMIDDPTGWTK